MILLWARAAHEEASFARLFVFIVLLATVLILNGKRLCLKCITDTLSVRILLKMN